MSARIPAAAAALALLAACHPQPSVPVPDRGVTPARRLDDVIRQPWQRVGTWMDIEVVRSGRLATVLATREGGRGRIVEESKSGYTIREVVLDCARRTVVTERAHGHIFGNALQRAPDPMAAIVTPGGVDALCNRPPTGPRLAPEDALVANMAKRGVALPRAADDGGGMVVDPVTGRTRPGYMADANHGPR